MATSRPRLSAAAPDARAGQQQDVDLGFEQGRYVGSRPRTERNPSKARDYETAAGRLGHVEAARDQRARPKDPETRERDEHEVEDSLRRSVIKPSTTPEVRPKPFLACATAHLIRRARS